MINRSHSVFSSVTSRVTRFGVAALTLPLVGVVFSSHATAHSATVPASASSAVSAPNTHLPAGTYCNQTPTQPTAAGRKPSSSDYNGPTKVLWIPLENVSTESLDQDDAADARFELDTLETQCGTLTDMHGETHGSESNYIASWLGTYEKQSLCDFPPNDDGKHACAYGPVTNYGNTPSIASLVQKRDGVRGWRDYAESAVENCQPFDGHGSSYAVRHNVPPYLPNIDCAQDEVPAGDWQAKTGTFYHDIVSGSLPAFSEYTPNDLDDGHDPIPAIPLSTNVGDLDNALARLLPIIQAGPDYQAGRLIVMITFDEGTTNHKAPYTDAKIGENCANPNQGNSQPSCQILTYIVGRYVPRLRDGDFTTHYSMLKTTQEILGLTPTNGYAWLGHAGDATTKDFYRQYKLAPTSWLKTSG